VARTRDPKVRHSYTMLCDQAIIDRQDRLTVVSAVRNLAFDRLPNTAHRLGVVVGFSAPAGQTYSVTIEDPRRKEIVKLGEDKSRRPEAEDAAHVVTETAFVCNIQNATFETEGIHSIVLRVDGRVVHRSPFGVIVRESGRGKG